MDKLLHDTLLEKIASHVWEDGMGHPANFRATCRALCAAFVADSLEVEEGLPFEILRRLTKRFGIALTSVGLPGYWTGADRGAFIMQLQVIEESCPSITGLHIGHDNPSYEVPGRDTVRVMLSSPSARRMLSRLKRLSAWWVGNTSLRHLATLQSLQSLHFDARSS